MKPKIVYHPQEHSNLTANFLQPIWREYFDCEPLDSKIRYDKSSTLFWSRHGNTDRWYHPYRDSGYKIVLDHLWDNTVVVSSIVYENVLTLRAGNWIWYNESLWYRSLGYDKYQRKPINNKLFLMLMRLERPHRDEILEKLQPFLEHALYSYVSKNILLADDIDKDSFAFQRHFNPSWYDSTSFSICVESTVNKSNDISEKTFKPLAFQHPFLIWGNHGTLTYLKSLGFETFDHCIDESYDLVQNTDLRLDKIFDQISSLFCRWKQDQNLFCDPISHEKIEHNFHLFYNSDIKSRFVREIVTPVLHFADA